MSNQYTTTLTVSPGVTVRYNPEQEWRAFRWEVSHDKGVDGFPTRAAAIEHAQNPSEQNRLDILARMGV